MTEKNKVWTHQEIEEIRGKNPYLNTYLENFKKNITLKINQINFSSIENVHQKFSELPYIAGKININSSQQGLGKTTSILNLMKKYTTQIKKKNNKKFLYACSRHNFIKEEIIPELEKRNIDYVYLRYPNREGEHNLCSRYLEHYARLSMMKLPQSYICGMCHVEDCEMSEINRKIKNANVIITVYELVPNAIFKAKNIDYIIYDEEVGREEKIIQPYLDRNNFSISLSFIKNNFEENIENIYDHEEEMKEKNIFKKFIMWLENINEKYRNLERALELLKIKDNSFSVISSPIETVLQEYYELQEILSEKSLNWVLKKYSIKILKTAHGDEKANVEKIVLLNDIINTSRNLLKFAKYKIMYYADVPDCDIFFVPKYFKTFDYYIEKNKKPTLIFLNAILQEKLLSIWLSIYNYERYQEEEVIKNIPPTFLSDDDFNGEEYIMKNENTIVCRIGHFNSIRNIIATYPKSSIISETQKNYDNMMEGIEYYLNIMKNTQIDYKKTGIITFEAIWENKIFDKYYKKLYFQGLEGSNILEDCEMGIIFGTFQVHPDAVLEEYIMMFKKAPTQEHLRKDASHRYINDITLGMIQHKGLQEKMMDAIERFRGINNNKIIFVFGEIDKDEIKKRYNYIEYVDKDNIGWDLHSQMIEAYSATEESETVIEEQNNEGRLSDKEEHILNQKLEKNRELINKSKFEERSRGGKIGGSKGGKNSKGVKKIIIPSLPVKYFYQYKISEKEGAYVIKSELYEAFLEYCNKKFKDFEKISRETFSKELLRLSENIISKQKIINKKTKEIWSGIELK